MDYGLESTVFKFPSCNKMDCKNITIVNDESFNITLVNTTGKRIMLDPMNGLVKITGKSVYYRVLPLCSIIEWTVYTTPH